MDKLIYLDIDGVLNHQDGYKSGDCSFNYEKKYQRFSKESKEYLNRLIINTGAKLVISSTWRSDGIDRLREIFKLEGVDGEIIGVTPHFSINGYGSAPRGVEIEADLKSRGFWHINWSEEEQMKYMVKSNIVNYVILDDDSDMLYGQRNHFVNVLPAPRNTSGFNKEYYNKALDILLSDVIRLNYGESNV
jgi:hypothetical protein